jgi:hypothetical protein
VGREELEVKRRIVVEGFCSRVWLKGIGDTSGVEAVFDTVDSEVGPDVHPDRDNSPGRVQQGNPGCAGLAHGA